MTTHTSTRCTHTAGRCDRLVCPRHEEREQADRREVARLDREAKRLAAYRAARRESETGV